MSPDLSQLNVAMAHRNYFRQKKICESSNWQHIQRLKIIILGANWQLFRLVRIAKCSYFILYTQNIKFYRFVMKIKNFLLPIWWYNRGWLPLGNKMKYIREKFTSYINICWLRTTRALTLFNNVLLRARRALMPVMLYSNSALLVLKKKKSLESDNALLTLNWIFANGVHNLRCKIKTESLFKCQIIKSTLKSFCAKEKHFDQHSPW